MFENVDGQTDGRTTDARVTGILIAHLGAFGSGELKRNETKKTRLPMHALMAFEPSIGSPGGLKGIQSSRLEVDNVTDKHMDGQTN